eukprot:m.20251 g.20251  ORF g.20251 m.20251 type:complete len:1376 (+) comp8138_c0_seq2:1105-5232(+)
MRVYRTLKCPEAAPIHVASGTRCSSSRYSLVSLRLVALSICLTIASSCTARDQCALVHDSFCTTNTSAGWYFLTGDPVAERLYGTGTFCSKTVASYRSLLTSPVDDVRAPPVAIRASLSDSDGLFGVGYLNSETSSPRSILNSVLSCSPSVGCVLTTQGGYVQRFLGTVDFTSSIKVAIHKVGPRTLHWALLNNDTVLLTGAKALGITSRSLLAATTHLSPGYGIGGEAEPCIYDFTALDPLCAPNCTSITDAQTCVSRSECMWHSNTCISYTSCPFNLNNKPEPCFNDVCQFTNPAGVDTACCDSMVRHCAQTRDDFGCDCEILGTFCPELACNSSGPLPPPELCAADVLTSWQLSRHCEPGLNSVVLGVAEFPDSGNLTVMCGAFVQTDAGLSCVSEPCLYPPESVEEGKVTCTLSANVTAIDDDVRLYLFKPNPVTEETNATCHLTTTALQVASHGVYAPQCMPCPRARAEIASIEPKCYLEKQPYLTITTALAMLEDAVACRFWLQEQDPKTNATLWVSSDALVSSVLYSSQTMVYCQFPDALPFGTRSEVTLEVEGYFENCPRPPLTDPAGVEESLAWNPVYLEETCHACQIEDGFNVTSAAVISSPCASNECSDVDTTGASSALCCNNIADFCSTSSCACTHVAIAGCSTALPCVAGSNSQVMGECGRDDHVVAVTVLEHVLLGAMQLAGERGLLEFLRDNVAELGIPRNDLTCFYLDSSSTYIIYHLFLHFASHNSQALFRDAIHSGSYSLFGSTSEGRTSTSKPSVPTQLSRSAKLGIVGAFVLIAAVVVGVESQRRRAKRNYKPEQDTEFAHLDVADDLKSKSGPVPAKAAKSLGVSDALARFPGYTEPVQSSLAVDNAVGDDEYALSAQDTVALTAFYNSPAQLAVCEVMGCTQLHLAAGLDDAYMTRLLLRSKPSSVQHLLASTDDSGQTPLMWACRSNGCLALQLLVEANSPLNVQDTSGNTALHHASLYGNVRALQILLDVAADPYVENQAGDLAINCAVRQNKPLALLHTMEQSVPICEVQNEKGVSLLVQSVVEGNDWLRDYILKNCASNPISKHACLSAVDKEGMTALHWAARVGDVAAAKALLRAGANANAVDNHGNTPLHLAADEGCGWTAAELLPATAIVPNREGHTPADLWHATAAHKYGQHTEQVANIGSWQAAPSVVASADDPATPSQSSLAPLQALSAAANLQNEQELLQAVCKDLDAPLPMLNSDLLPLDLFAIQPQPDESVEVDVKPPILPALPTPQAEDDILFQMFPPPLESSLTSAAKDSSTTPSQLPSGQSQVSWTSSDEQRERNRLSCKVRRARLKQQELQVQQRITRAEASNAHLKAALAAIQRDRNLLLLATANAADAFLESHV